MNKKKLFEFYYLFKINYFSGFDYNYLPDKKWLKDVCVLYTLKVRLWTEKATDIKRESIFKICY